MTYVPIAYIPDGPVTAALKRHVKQQRPKPQLGNLGPLLDENLTAAKKHGHFRYHPDDLKLLKGVTENPDVVDEGFEVLRGVMTKKGIDVPDRYEREVPYYPDIPRIVKYVIALAALMTVAITAAVLLLQDDGVALMTVLIVAVSLLGAAAAFVIFDRCVIRVDPDPKSNPNPNPEDKVG